MKITAKNESFLSFVKVIADHRHVLLAFIKRDFKTRYFETKGGNIWFILQPLLTLLLLTVFIGYVAKVDTKEVPYALFFLSGLVPVTLFNNTLIRMGMSLIENSYIIQKTYVPRAIFPLTQLGGVLFDFIIMLAFLSALTFWFGYVPALESIWLLPLLLAGLLMISVSCGLLASVYCVIWKDLRVIIPILAQMMIFICPVIYPSELIPAKYLGFYLLNPVAAIIEILRSFLLGKSDVSALAWISPAFFSVTITTFALYTFYKNENSINERL